MGRGSKNQLLSCQFSFTLALSSKTSYIFPAAQSASQFSFFFTLALSSKKLATSFPAAQSASQFSFFFTLALSSRALRFSSANSTAPVVIAYASEVMARKSEVSTKRNSTTKMQK